MSDVSQNLIRQSLDQSKKLSSYKGGINVMGQPQGRGECRFQDGSFFQGEFDNGLPKNGKLSHYQGKFIFSNGCVYTGELVHGVPQGLGLWQEEKGSFDGYFENQQFVRGTVTYKDKTVYSGGFKNGRKHGSNCTFTYPDGDVFRGEFENDNFKEGTLETKEYKYAGNFNQGMKEGMGRLTVHGKYEYNGNFCEDFFHGVGELKDLKNMSRYEGTFKKGMRDGEGQYSDKNYVYNGSFQNNKRHGKGILKFANGKKYDGDFMNNKFHGIGYLTYSDGSQYKGMFENDKKEGKGRLQIKTKGKNDIYEGQFKMDLLNGYGIYYYTNGDVYKGNFLNNKKHGAGVYDSIEFHTVYEGIWTNDQRNGHFSEQDKDTKITKIGSYVDGERHGQFKVLKDGETIRVQKWVKGCLSYT